MRTTLPHNAQVRGFGGHVEGFGGHLGDISEVLGAIFEIFQAMADDFGLGKRRSAVFVKNFRPVLEATFVVCTLGLRILEAILRALGCHIEAMFLVLGSIVENRLGAWRSVNVKVMGIMGKCCSHRVL